ncbi:MAG: EamA family transporter [Simkaniaceae bacterium]|nr:EamA family transporter [Simkaniaceae bacterium]
MKLKTLFILILLALCWGPSFLFIKIALEHIPPLTIVTGRVALAACMLLCIVKLQGKHLFKWLCHWRVYLVMALCASTLPFALITYGETSISSSVAGIINGSVPIFTALIAYFTIKEENITRKKCLGIAIGFVGIVIVFAPHLMDTNIRPEIGMLFVLIASISYAVGMIYARKQALSIPGLILPTWQLIFSTLILLPLSLMIDRPWNLPMPPISAIFSLVALAFLGTAVAFYLYYTLLRLRGAVYLSTSTLLFPVVAIVLGVIFLSERPAWNEYFGALLILAGLVITNSIFSSKKPPIHDAK